MLIDCKLVLKWLEHLMVQQKSYEVLKDAHYAKEPHIHRDEVHQGLATHPYLCEHVYARELHLPFQLPERTFNELRENFVKLQDKIRSRPAITHNQLFSYLHPLAHRFYEALKEKYETTPLEAYRYIHNSNHEEIYLEDILAPHAHEVLGSGMTVAAALKELQPQKAHSQEQDKQADPAQNAQTLWTSLDLKSQGQLKPFLELAAKSFGSCFEDKTKVHSSWLQDSLLFQALEEKVSLKVIDFLITTLKLDPAVRNPQTHQSIFHIAVQNKYSPQILNFLSQTLTFEERLQGLNALDKQGLSPLDYVMENHIVGSFRTLHNLGATACNPMIAVKFYKNMVKENTRLHMAFQSLMALNPAVEWHIALEELLPPLTTKKAPGEITVISTTYGERQLPKEIERQIINEKDAFIPISDLGNHQVAYASKIGPLNVKHGLYFKAYPALSGIEEAAGGLTRQLLGFGAPHTDLIKLGNVPVLISQEVPGDTLLKVLKTNPSLLYHLDEEDISGMLIAAMLINPEDGKPDNYIVTPHPTKSGKYRIVGIDNDQAFVPAVVKEQPTKARFTGRVLPIAQVKTILYCLNQMKSPVHANLRTRIINTLPDIFLEPWLQNLQRVNDQQCALFTGPEQTQAFKQHKCFIGVPFQRGAVKHLYEKFTQLRDILNTDPDIPHIDLLAKLEPRLAKRYQAALSKDISVEER